MKAKTARRVSTRWCIQSGEESGFFVPTFAKEGGCGPPSCTASSPLKPKAGLNGHPFFFDGEEDEGLQQVVEIVGVAEIGARLFDDLGDGRRVEFAGLFEDRGGQGAAELHGAGAALFERGIVEEGVGIGVENFVRELRGHRGIDGNGLDAAVADGFEDAAEAVDVHGLVHDVFHDFFDQGVVGDLDIALDVFKAGGDVGEDGGEEVVASHALNLRRDFLAVLEAEECEGAVGVPTEAGGEDGRAGEYGLLKNLLDGFGLEEVEDIGEGEAVLFGRGDADAVVGGGGLQLEVEAAAEALAQGQSPGAVDARSEGRMDDELHAAAFVKEALGDDGTLGGNRAEDGAAFADVGGELAKRVGIEEG